MSAFRFRKKTDYGLAMLALLCERYGDGYVSVVSMQERNLPRSFLVKIAQDLIEAGLVGSKEGRGGGYYLSKPPREISLREAIVALEGKVSTSNCVLHPGSCPFEESCKQRKFMHKLSEDFVKVLDRYTLEDVCSE